QTTYGNPACATQRWQTVKYRWTSFRIVTDTQLTFRYVIGQNATSLFSGLTYQNQMTIDTDFQSRCNFNTHAEFSNFAINTHTTGFNNRFDFTARTVAGTRQHFL